MQYPHGKDWVKSKVKKKLVIDKNDSSSKTSVGKIYILNNLRICFCRIIF